MDSVTRTETKERDSETLRIRARRTGTPLPPAVLLVGASTGGPQALASLLTGLVPVVPFLPICVTLHMPPDLMPVVAAHLTRICGVETVVVESPQTVTPGVVYFAPGNRHLEFRRQAMGSVEVGLRPSRLNDFCKPAVDVMLQSGSACFGARTLAVVLSGMGQDGLEGAQVVVKAGGNVFVQDKASSAVWGMPGAIAKAELATAILTPAALADEIVRRFALTRKTA